MDWSLIIFVLVTLLFAWRGYRAGFTSSLGQVLGVLAGYAAAFLFGATLSGWLEALFGLQGLVALGTAAVALFVLGDLAVVLIFMLLRQQFSRGGAVSTASALGGGFVGALFGLLIAIAIVWSFALLRDMPPSVTADAAVPADRSGIETLANRLAGRAVAAAVGASSAGPEVARLSGALMAAPTEVMQRIQRVTASAEFEALMQDPRNRQALDSGDPELLRRLPDFRALAANPDVLALAEIAGYTDGGDVEAQIARHLADIWVRSQRVKNDPRVQEIIADPVFHAALESGDPVALLLDRRLLELAEIIFADEAAAPAASQSTAGESAGGDSAEPAVIYQWTDSSGRIHYSDQKPED